jgi:hypothetical protein
MAFYWLPERVVKGVTDGYELEMSDTMDSIE